MPAMLFVRYLDGQSPFSTTKHRSEFMAAAFGVLIVLLCSFSPDRTAVSIAARRTWNQPPDAGSHRAGRVVGRISATNGRPVLLARITVDGYTREGVTDQAGAFVLDSVPAGTQMLHVRAIGYAPRDTSVLVVDGASTTVNVTLDPIAALPGVTTLGVVESERLADFLRAKKASSTGAYFVQPAEIEGHRAQQTVCQLIGGLPRIGHCRPVPARGMSKITIPLCDRKEGFILNGEAVRLNFDDIDPSVILGVAVASTEDRLGSRYGSLARALHLCPVVVWTR
ncbi:MAG: carboxypeptidase-like regulatory domain-containing protein [Solirubrobacterales bacterium]